MWDLWLERAKPIVPVIVIDDLDTAVPLAEALTEGGICLLEVTLRTDAGLEAIKKIKDAVPKAIVGAGTVTTLKQFAHVVEAGAEFVVSPGMTDSLLDAAREWGGPYLPGVATPSEVMRARDAGFTHMKFFPAAAAGGIPMLNSIRGPLPDVKFCPTGGIDIDSSRHYLALDNVFAVGGSWLTPKKLIENRDWNAITGIAIAS